MDWHPKSNILDRKTPLLAGYPSANISKQKVRRVRLSGLLRPRIPLLLHTNDTELVRIYVSDLWVVGILHSVCLFAQDSKIAKKSIHIKKSGKTSMNPTHTQGTYIVVNWRLYS